MKQSNIVYLEILEIFLTKNEEENYYKPNGVGKFYSNNYIERGSNKTLSIEEYLNKSRP